MTDLNSNLTYLITLFVPPNTERSRLSTEPPTSWLSTNCQPEASSQWDDSPSQCLKISVAYLPWLGLIRAQLSKYEFSACRLRDCLTRSSDDTTCLWEASCFKQHLPVNLTRVTMSEIGAVWPDQRGRTCKGKQADPGNTWHPCDGSRRGAITKSA